MLLLTLLGLVAGDAGTVTSRTGTWRSLPLCECVRVCACASTEGEEPATALFAFGLAVDVVATAALRWL